MVVRAKRAGWKEKLTGVQALDLDPYESSDDDLEGELEVVRGDVPGVGEVVVHLVDGQEADPETVHDTA